MRSGRVAGLGLALAAAFPSLADVVVLTDGGTLEGRVSETPQGIQVTFPNGASAIIPKERVARIEKKPSVVDLYQERRKALAADDLAGMLDLADWAAGNGLERASGKLAQQVLAKDPASVRAHALLGEYRVGGEFVTPGEASARGYARLAKGWGEWDERYSEDAAALALPPEVLGKAREALDAWNPEAMAAMKLPARAWSLLLHRRALAPPEGGPATGRLENPDQPSTVLAWVPEGHDGLKEIPCLLALADPGEGLEGTYARWQAAAQARGLALLCPAPARDPFEAVRWLRSKGAAVDLNRLILAGFRGGAEEGWTLLERHADKFCSALLVSLPPEGPDPADLSNLRGLAVFAVDGEGDPQATRRRLTDRLGSPELERGRSWLRTLKGKSAELPPEALAALLDEALRMRRAPWPEHLKRRVRAGDAFAWVQVDALVEGLPEGGQVEAQVAPHNTIILASRGVRRLTLHLSDDLLDLSKPVTVTLNGRQVFRGMLQPDLKAMLDRFRETGDRHRVATVTLPLEVLR